MTRKELPKVLAGLTQVRISLQQSLDSIRHIAGQASISHRPRNRLMFAYATAETEVVRVPHLAADFDFLAFDSNVSDPMLSAAIGAARHMQPKLLIKPGQSLFQLF